MAALLLAAWPPLLGAAEKEQEKPPGRFKLGVFYLTPKIELKSAGYDSNVFNTETGTFSDSNMILRPSLEAALPVGRRFRFKARGHLDFNWFRTATTERSTDKGFEFRGEADLGPLTLFGETGASWSKQRFSIDLDDRVPLTQTSANTGLRVKATRKLTFGGSVGGRDFDVDGSISPEAAAVEPTLDRRSRTLGFDASYALTPRTAFVATGESIRDSFDQAIGAAGREVTSARYLAGLSFGARAFLSGRIAGGVRVFPSDPASAAPSYSGPVLKADLAVPLTHLARLVLLGEREVYYSAEPGVAADGQAARNSFVAKRYEASLTGDLPFDLLGRFFYGWQGADYHLPVSVEEALLERQSRLNLYGLSLLRVFGETFKIGGGVTWERRKSTLPGGGYEATRYGLQAELTP